MTPPPTLVAALLLSATLKPAAFERVIRFEGEGRVAVTLDREVYDAAQADLRDLRVEDDQAQSVPYLLDRGRSDRAPSPVPTSRNRTFVRGQTETVVLDFGRAVGKRRLLLRLSGDNFRRRVEVEGSADGQLWAALVDGAYVFAVPPPEARRYEAVELPPNDFPLLRLTVFHGPDDPERVEIESARLGDEPAPTRQVLLPLAFERAEDQKRRETVVTVDLGARYQPFDGLVLEVADARFFRGVEVEARREREATRREPASVVFASLGDGCVYRYDEGGRVREQLRVEGRGREKALRLRIRNRDDRPLDLRAVAAAAPVERVVFEALLGRAYRLTYGTPDRGAPDFDLARTVADVSAWAAAAGEARLDPPRAAAAGAGETRPWTDRHPALLWVVLLAAVVVLGGLTANALRHAG